MNCDQTTECLSLLSLISNTYTFQDLRPVHPSLADLGSKRVVSVVINELAEAELGLADNSDPESVEYYSLDRLVISPARAIMQAQKGAGSAPAPAPCAAALA